MKKALITVVIYSLVLGMSATGALAQERQVSVFLNIGGVWNVWIVPEYVDLSIQTDIRLNKLLMISPEISFWSRGLRYSTFYFAPTGVLNLTVGRLFAGAGFTALKWISSYAGDSGWSLRPRFNIGYMTRHFKLTAAAVPASGFVYGLVAVGLGF